jgi:hypothetical protein
MYIYIYILQYTYSWRPGCYVASASSWFCWHNWNPYHETTTYCTGYANILPSSTHPVSDSKTSKDKQLQDRRHTRSSTGIPPCNGLVRCTRRFSGLVAENGSSGNIGGPLVPASRGCTKQYKPVKLSSSFFLLAPTFHLTSFNLSLSQQHYRYEGLIAELSATTARVWTHAWPACCISLVQNCFDDFQWPSWPSKDPDGLRLFG